MADRDFKKTGLDRALPYIEVLMDNTDPAVYPRYPLPEGYDFRFYEPGMEAEFAKLHHLVGGTSSVKDGLDIFAREFSPFIGELTTRMIYVTAPDGGCAGTACLWRGDHTGQNSPRVHWVAVHPDHQNKGLMKALMTRLFDLHHTLGLPPYLYLTTQTWSYKAINVYIEFGFSPLMHTASLLARNITGNGEALLSSNAFSDEALGWNLIFDKIAQYEKTKEKRKNHGE